MPSIDPTLFAGLATAGLAVVCARLLKQRRSLVLLVWPGLIYLIGPAATLIFVQHPVLGRYVDPERLNVQTATMVAYLAMLLVADRFLDLSAALTRALDGAALARLSRSPAFVPLYVGAALAAAVLQVYTLATVGNIFNGIYVLESAADGDVPWWGFLAGLYELVFLGFILVLLGERPRRGRWWLYLGLYLATTLLRVLGGTRLILIKELAFMMLFFVLRGSVRPRRLVVGGAIVVVLGSAIGLVRNGGVDDANAFLGPLYGLVMESALNALTYGIADQVNHAGVVARQGDLLGSIAFFVASVVPSFLRFGIGEADLQALSPYALALRHGFDTWAPVGGMSGFATIDYLTSQPLPFLAAMVGGFAFWFRFKRPGAFKQMLALVLAINAIHFWRDPADIAFKLVVQGLLVCLLLRLLPGRRRGARRTPSVLLPGPVPPSAPVPTIAPALP